MEIIILLIYLSPFSLTGDGKRILHIAQLLCFGTNEQYNEIRFVKRRAMPSKKDLYIFVRKDAPRSPASSYDGYACVTQGYAKAIRIMCARIWSDALIYPEFSYGSNFFFPNDNPSGDIPEGAEVPWVQHRGGYFDEILKNDLVPSWMQCALRGMSGKRLRIYKLATDFAISFILLHEIGHNDLQHFTSGFNSSHTRQCELEADCFAFRCLLSRMPTTKSDHLAMIIAAFVTGLLACFMVFQIKCVLEQKATLIDMSSKGYPSIRERICQMFASLREWQNTNIEKGVGDYISILDTFLTVGNFHPVYSHVIGIPWMSNK